uniref:Uncharacterized protein n=1 Tax=Nomascus leucogenys TaxID=61853 RepID=A0A2I3GZF7_NOMLE
MKPQYSQAPPSCWQQEQNPNLRGGGGAGPLDVPGTKTRPRWARAVVVQALCTEPQNMLNKPPKLRGTDLPWGPVIFKMRKQRHSCALIQSREGLWVSRRARNRPQLPSLANRYPHPVAAGAEGLEIGEEAPHTPAPKAMRETEAQEGARSVRRKVGRAGPPS